MPEHHYRARHGGGHQEHGRTDGAVDGREGVGVRELVKVNDYS